MRRGWERGFGPGQRRGGAEGSGREVDQACLVPNHVVASESRVGSGGGGAGRGGESSAPDVETLAGGATRAILSDGEPPGAPAGATS